MSASTFFGVEGKLENISVIANDSILIEVRVCMCVINELSFGTLRKYFYSLFFLHRIFLSCSLSLSLHHYTTLPSDLLLPSSFYSHFKKRCLTTIAEAAVVSKEHQPPSNRFHKCEQSVLCEWRHKIILL